MVLFSQGLFLLLERMLSLVCVVVALDLLKLRSAATPCLDLAAGKPEDPCGILGEAIHGGWKAGISPLRTRLFIEDAEGCLEAYDAEMGLGRTRVSFSKSA